MPHRNVIRELVSDTSYHCYNRGVEKRDIFMDEQDYRAFLRRLELMLINPELLESEKPSDRIRIKSFYGEVELYAYILMPNHYHLLLYQIEDNSLPEFMRTLSTSYTMYFNQKYRRAGSLFQGRYKARRVDNAAYAVHVSRYIHLNGLAMPGGYEGYEYSSMPYLREPYIAPSWLNVNRVLEDFGGSYEAYDKFVKEYATPDEFEQIRDRFSLT